MDIIRRNQINEIRDEENKYKRTVLDRLKQTITNYQENIKPLNIVDNKVVDESKNKSIEFIKQLNDLNISINLINTTGNLFIRLFKNEDTEEYKKYISLLNIVKPFLAWENFTTEYTKGGLNLDTRELMKVNLNKFLPYLQSIKINLSDIIHKLALIYIAQNLDDDGSYEIAFDRISGGKKYEPKDKDDMEKITVLMPLKEHIETLALYNIIYEQIQKSNIKNIDKSDIAFEIAKITKNINSDFKSADLNKSLIKIFVGLNLPELYPYFSRGYDIFDRGVRELESISAVEGLPTGEPAVLPPPEGGDGGEGGPALLPPTGGEGEVLPPEGGPAAGVVEGGPAAGVVEGGPAAGVVEGVLSPEELDEMKKLFVIKDEAKLINLVPNKPDEGTYKIYKLGYSGTNKELEKAVNNIKKAYELLIRYSSKVVNKDELKSYNKNLSRYYKNIENPIIKKFLVEVEKPLPPLPTQLKIQSVKTINSEKISDKDLKQPTQIIKFIYTGSDPKLISLVGLINTSFTDVSEIYDDIERETYGKYRLKFLDEYDLYNIYYKELFKDYKDLVDKAKEEFLKSTGVIPATTTTPATTKSIKYYQRFGTKEEGKDTYIKFDYIEGKDEYNDTLDKLDEKIKEFEKIKKSDKYFSASASEQKKFTEKVRKEILDLKNKANLLLKGEGPTTEPLDTAFTLPTIKDYFDQLVEYLTGDLSDSRNRDILYEYVNEVEKNKISANQFKKAYDALENVDFAKLNTIMSGKEYNRENLEAELDKLGEREPIPYVEGSGKNKKLGRKQLLKNLDKPFKNKKPILGYKDDMNDLYYNSDSSSSSSSSSSDW